MGNRKEPTPAPLGAKPEAPPAPPVRQQYGRPAPLTEETRRYLIIQMARESLVDKIVARLGELAAAPGDGEEGDEAVAAGVRLAARVVRADFP